MEKLPGLARSHPKFAALVLGVGETFVASVIDPGLTLVAAYALFILILLFRPQGFFGRKPT